MRWFRSKTYEELMSLREQNESLRINNESLMKNQAPLPEKVFYVTTVRSGLHTVRGDLAVTSQWTGNLEIYLKDLLVAEFMCSKLIGYEAKDE